MAAAVTTQPPDTDEAFQAFMHALRDDGLRPALSYLRGLTDYRFLAIFRFRAGKATAAAFVDQQAPDVTGTPEVPDTATYCCYVRDSGGVFTTANAMLDERLAGHPARAVVPAYCGVPIMDSEGAILGTLCHYDLVPRDPEQIDLPLMLQVASALAQRGLVPPYPSQPAQPA